MFASSRRRLPRCLPSVITLALLVVAQEIAAGFRTPAMPVVPVAVLRLVVLRQVVAVRELADMAVVRVVLAVPVAQGAAAVLAPVWIFPACSPACQLARLRT